MLVVGPTTILRIMRTTPRESSLSVSVATSPVTQDAPAPQGWMFRHDGNRAATVQMSSETAHLTGQSLLRLCDAIHNVVELPVSAKIVLREATEHKPQRACLIITISASAQEFQRASALLANRPMPQLLIEPNGEVNREPEVLYLQGGAVPRVVLDPEQPFTLPMVAEWMAQLKEVTRRDVEFEICESGYPSIYLFSGIEEDFSQVVESLWSKPHYAVTGTAEARTRFSDTAQALAVVLTISTRNAPALPLELADIKRFYSISKVDQHDGGNTIRLVMSMSDTSNVVRRAVDFMRLCGIHPVGEISHTTSPRVTVMVTPLLSDHRPTLFEKKRATGVQGAEAPSAQE